MTELHQLRPLVSDFREVRVLCMGDMMVDRFVYGEVERVSPEAPIPVLRRTSEKIMLGGAGNVARNVVALGGKVVFLSVLGNDETAKKAMELIASEQNITPCIFTEAGRETTIKTRFVANNQQLLRADQESVAAVQDETADRLIQAFADEMDEVDVVLLSDYAKGVFTEKVLSSIIEIAHKTGKPIIADTKSNAISRYKGVTLIKPNAREAELATGLSCETDEQVALVADEALRISGVEAVLITRSEKGMFLAKAGGPRTALSARAAEVYDVSGAGDTVLATLGLVIGTGAELDVAAQIANVAAGLVVAKTGTAVVHPDELSSALQSAEYDGIENKIRNLASGLDLIARWREHGQSIGFTNGCFDLVHPGHLSLIRQARASCDRLILGLNSDASVKRLKGENRPAQGELARAMVLASMADVDMVVIFEEDTPIDLIQSILPDVLVKGADYTVQTVVGSDIVIGNGGRVLLASLEDGFSTTNTIARLNAAKEG